MVERISRLGFLRGKRGHAKKGNPVLASRFLHVSVTYSILAQTRHLQQPFERAFLEGYGISDEAEFLQSPAYYVKDAARGLQRSSAGVSLRSKRATARFKGRRVYVDGVDSAKGAQTPKGTEDRAATIAIFC